MSLINLTCRNLVGVVALLSAVLSANAHSTVIDFESLADLEDLTTQYSGIGVTFSNATALTAGISLYEVEFPPFSGSNAVFDNSGPLSVSFTSAAGSVGGYFNYAAPITLVAYDLSNAVIGSARSLFDSNLALSGFAGSTPNEFLQWSAVGGISRIEITGDPAGGSFTLDDLIFTEMVTAPPQPLQPPSGVPEPETLVLILIGSAMLWIRSRKPRVAQVAAVV